MKTAYTTTLCNGEGYLPGVEALGKSLEAHGTKVPRIVLVTADAGADARTRLTEQGWQVREVEPLDNPNPDTAQLFERFRNVYTKLRAWELVDLDKVVLLDADMITLQNIDEQFKRPSTAAAPDFFLPDRFNSGLMVIEPSADPSPGATPPMETSSESATGSTTRARCISGSKESAASHATDSPSAATRSA